MTATEELDNLNTMLRTAGFPTLKRSQYVGNWYVKELDTWETQEVYDLYLESYRHREDSTGKIKRLCDTMHKRTAKFCMERVHGKRQRKDGAPKKKKSAKRKSNRDITPDVVKYAAEVFCMEEQYHWDIRP